MRLLRLPWRQFIQALNGHAADCIDPITEVNVTATCPFKRNLGDLHQIECDFIWGFHASGTICSAIGSNGAA